MPGPTPDADFEKHRWNLSGPGWDRWADPLAESGAWINSAMLDRLEIAPGGCLLDLAAGAGEPALTAADRLGPDGLVLATDLVAPMLLGARRRAATSPVGTRLSFCLADMTALPLADRQMDYVTCRFGLMFVPDAVAACAEMARVLRPGGRAVVAVWGPLAQNTLFQVLDAALGEVMGPDPANGLVPLFRFADDHSLAPIFHKAGFTAVVEEGIVRKVTAPLSRPFWRATLDMAFAARLRGATADQLAAVDAAARRRFAALAQGPGGSALGDDSATVPLTLSVRLCTARLA